jgi:DNA primase
VPDDRVALIRQIKEASDIVDVVGGYLALRPAGGTFKGLCPFHDDSRPSFDVDPRRQRYRCWSCGKYGDVLSFVQEHEHCTFREALELLARRAGIVLTDKGASPEAQGRALLLDVVRWAAEQYHECLLETPLAAEARAYLGERRLLGETVRRFGLGYAPLSGDWLVQRADAAGVPFDQLEKVGLIARRQANNGWYDRFRDRVMFPIRDAMARPVAFGGRIMPNSPYKDRAPKYYNSCDTPLFSKSEHLYGLDQARHAAAKTGYLAVVEGYTDVLMAHQSGIGQVVATMGTALNARHVQHLRRFAPRVVLVFDADAGGDTGVDRALEIFASQEVDLSVATLPEGLDPCDLLVQRGPDSFLEALSGAVDALDFKLNRVLSAESGSGVEGRRRAVDAVLRVIALAPDLSGEAGALKRQLIVTRIAQRLTLREETVWARLGELRDGIRKRADREPRRAAGDRSEESEGPRAAKPAPEERELLEVLLADPELVSVAAREVAPEQLRHPGLRRALQGLYQLQAAGETPDLDRLRLKIDNLRLAEHLLLMQEVGRHHKDRAAWLQGILAAFRKRQTTNQTQELQNQLHAAGDHDKAVELLRRLQDQTTGSEPRPINGERRGA